MKNSYTLKQLMRRGDIWQGHSQRFATTQIVATGHPQLEPMLVNKGWPTASLIEVCQPVQYGYGEWLLMTPALIHMQAQQAGYSVLLNPPALPFCQGLIQSGLDLNTLLVIRTHNKPEFIASFVELARASCCHSLLAWQPQTLLSYSEQRKCLLACHEDQGLYVMFSPMQQIQQSSPASLRLAIKLTETSLNVFIHKQKGQLQSTQVTPAELPLPDDWLEQYSNSRASSPAHQQPPNPN